jgi:hypothetical protein
MAMVVRIAAGWYGGLDVDDALRYIVIDDADIMEATNLR